MSDKIERYVNSILNEIPKDKKGYVSKFLNEFLQNKDNQSAVKADSASFRHVIIFAVNAQIEEAVFKLLSEKANQIKKWNGLSILIMELAAHTDKAKIVIEWFSKPENSYVQKHVIGFTEFVREVNTKELKAELEKITEALNNGEKPEFMERANLLRKAK